MLISKSSIADNRTKRLWIIAVAVFAVLSGAFVLAQGYTYIFAESIALAVGVSVATMSPLISVVVLLLIAVLPTVFQTTPIFSEDYAFIGRGLHAFDIVLLLMGAALVVQTLRGKEAGQKKIGLSIYVTLFALLILFEILRNIPAYGISAAGEFRYRYLILVLPLYVSLFFDSAKTRLKLLKWLIFSSVFFPLICIPIIGALKGWSIGSYEIPFRFLPASISLGLVWGILALSLAKKYGLIKVSRSFLWILATLVSVLVLIDSHRSVWLTTAVVFLLLIWLKEIRLSGIWSWGTITLLALAIVWVVVSSTGLNIIKYVTVRGVAFVNPEGDPTSAWRLAEWEAQMSKFYGSPVIGEGFGGYFGLSGLKGDIGVSPHSLYVQTLVKIGIIGMLLYLVIVFKVLSALKRWIRTQRARDNPEIAIVLTALISLIAAHAYYSVYTFEYYNWLFVGLGVAVIRDNHNGKS